MGNNKNEEYFIDLEAMKNLVVLLFNPGKVLKNIKK